MADRFAGPLSESPYFGNYERWLQPWRLAVGEVDGEPVIIIHLLESTGLESERVARLEVTDHRVTRIADYLHCPWVLSAAASVVVGDPIN